MSEQTKISPEIAKAIVAVMQQVRQLGKEDRNKFQNYDFVSIDKFLAYTGPLCAAAGLFILQEEETFEVEVKQSTDDKGQVKTAAWLTVKYAFTFCHSSGDTYGPLHRSVMVPANGAQAFGSAQSYALKQFLRAQFQIPTGDEDDPDLHGETLPVSSAIDAEHIQILQVGLDETGSDIRQFCKYMGVSSLAEIPLKVLPKALQAIDAKRKAKTKEVAHVG